MPVRGLSASQVGAAVSRLLDQDVVEVRAVPGSVANQDFLVTLGDGGRVMVKCGPPAELSREAWVCRRLSGVGLAVPRILVLDLANVALGGLPVLVMAVVPGGRSGERLVAREVGEMFRRVHTQTLPGWGEVDVVGDDARGRHDSWEASVLDVLDGLDELVDARVLDRSVADAVRSQVTPGDRFAYEGPGVLLHNDLKVEHVFAQDVGDGPRLTAVIDWGDASVGDPDVDLARLSMAGPEPTAGYLDGYGTRLTTELRDRLARYRILWNIGSLSYEYRAGGTGFDPERDSVVSDLHLLA